MSRYSQEMDERYVVFEGNSEGSRLLRMLGANAGARVEAAEPVFDIQRSAGNHAVATRRGKLAHPAGQAILDRRYYR